MSQMFAGAHAAEAGSEASAQGSTTGRRKKLNYLVRLVFGLVVIGILLWKSDLRLVLGAIAQVGLAWLGLSILVQLVGKVVWAMRWSATLEIYDVHVPFWTLVRAIFVGQFFNNFLPSSVGGDLYRGYWILEDRKMLRKSVFLVLMERFLGLIALGYVALPAFLYVLLRGHLNWNLNLGLILLFLVGLCSSVLLLHPAVYALFDRLLALFRISALADLRAKVADSLELLYRAGWLKWKAFLLSVLVQIVGVAFFYCLGRGLGLPMASWHYLVIVPLVVVITMLPVSINGLGVREGALVVLTGALGLNVAASRAIALGLLSTAVVLVVSLIGGGFYIAGNRRNAE